MAALRDFDADLVGNLELHALIAEPRDLAVDAAGRDDPIADLQAVEKLLHLLLLALHRQQDDEIEDRQDERERDELQPGAAAFRRAPMANTEPTSMVIMNRAAGGTSC